MSPPPTSLSTIALLGTARETPFPEPSNPLLAKPWQGINQADRPRAVLQAAALESVALRAGVQTTTGIPLPPKAAPESRHFIPESAVRAAQHMLAGDFPQGFDEWLAATADADFAAPHRILPTLLDHGSRNRELRPLITRIAGQRGIWLARRNEPWSWLLQTVSVPEDTWEIGSPDERLAWLLQTRSNDPQRAAAAIAADWNNESPELRESIAQLVAASPTPADTTWLENLALRDRRQNTRDAAIRALSRLPESAFLRRTSQRIRQLLNYRRSGLGKILSLDPPETFDPNWSSDGIREKAPQGTGEKAWWMGQLLAQAPISHWAAQLELPVEKLLQARLDPDWTAVIRQAWIDTIQRFPEPECIRLLIPRLIHGKDGTQNASQSQQQLYNLLPRCLQPLAPTTIADILEQSTLPAQLHIALLVRFRPPLNPSTHKKLFKLLTSCWSQKDCYLTRPDAAALAYCPTPETIPRLLQAMAAQSDLSSDAEEFARALEFRQSYLPHLKPI